MERCQKGGCQGRRVGRKSDTPEVDHPSFVLVVVNIKTERKKDEAGGVEG